MLWENSMIILNHENELVKIKTDLMYLALWYVYLMKYNFIKLKKIKTCWILLVIFTGNENGKYPHVEQKFYFWFLLDWKSNIKKFDIMPGTACIS